VTTTAKSGADAVSRTDFDGLDIVFVDLDASRALLDREEAITPRLSTSDRHRVDRLYGDPERQCHWRAARIATRIVLERSAGPGVRGAEFEIASGGRPSLGAAFPHFNVSHTANVALIAVCQSSPVGVDIECLRTLKMSLERRRRIITAAADITRFVGADPDSDVDVLKAWVRLEAVAKARGSGIGVLLTEEGVIGGTGKVARNLEQASPATASLDVEAPYIAAVAADTLPAKVGLRRFPSSAEALRDFMI